VANTNVLIAMGIVMLFIFFAIYSLMKRIKRCPNDRILVVFGRVGPNANGVHEAKLYNGGAVFIWPIIQDHDFLDLTPMNVSLELNSVLSRENMRHNVRAKIMIAISKNIDEARQAAERLLGLGQQEIYDVAKELMTGQFRLVIASDPATEILNNPHVFLDNIKVTCASELRKIGMVVMDVQILDIKS
jgi:flotillin